MQQESAKDPSIFPASLQVITFPKAMQRMPLLLPLGFPPSGSEKGFNMESKTESITRLLLGIWAAGTGLHDFSLI